MTATAQFALGMTMLAVVMLGVIVVWLAFRVNDLRRRVSDLESNDL
jgi:hypothetical protein